MLELGQTVSSSLEESLNKIFSFWASSGKPKSFRKAIASLPDQVLTYNQAATAKIDRQLSELRDDISER